MPIHIAGPVAPAADCPAKVSQRKAPGAIRAMAFIVKPVSPRVFFISVLVSAIGILLCVSSISRNQLPSLAACKVWPSHQERDAAEHCQTHQHGSSALLSLA